MSAGVVEHKLIIDTSKGTIALSKVGEKFEEIGSKSTRAGQKARNAFDQIYNKLAKLQHIAQLAERAFHLLSGPIANLIQTASNAEEITGKFFAVFKNIAPAAQQWVNKFSDAVGRSRTMVKDWISRLQDTFVPLGFARQKAFEFSATLTKLAVDLSSFNNVAEADAIADLQSAIVGNHETMRKYGVIINQTVLHQELLNMKVQGGIKNATEAQKAQARLNVIMKGTADAQGDAIRTADGFANRMRAFISIFADLKEVAGEQIIRILIPYMQQLKQWISNNRAEIDLFAKQAGQQIGKFLQLLINVGQFLWKWRSELIELAKVLAFAFALKKINDFKKSIIEVVGSLGSAKEAVGSLGKSVTGAAGHFKNFHAYATAAFIGWQIGSRINDITGLQRKMAEMSKADVDIEAAQSALRNGMKLHAFETQILTDKMYRLGKQYKINENNITKLAKALKDKKEIYAGLSIDMKIFIDRFAKVEEANIATTKAEEAAKKKTEALREEKEKLTEAMKKEIEETNKLSRSLGIYGREGIADLEMRTKRLIKVSETNAQELEHNKTAQEKMRKEVTKLTSEYKDLQRTAPEAVQQLATKLKLLEDVELDNLDPLFKQSDEQIKIMNEQVERSADLMEDEEKAAKADAEALKKLREETIKATFKKKDLLDKLIDLTDEMNAFADMTQQAVDTLAGFGIISNSTASILTGMIGGIGQFSSGLSAIKEAGSGLTGTFQKIGGAISMISGVAAIAVPVISGLVNLITGTDWKRYSYQMLSGISTATKEMKDQLSEVAEQMGSVGKAYRSLLDEFIETADIRTKDQFNEWLKEVHKLAIHVNTTGEGLNDLDDALFALSNRGVDTFGYLGKEFRAMIESIDDAGLKAHWFENQLLSGVAGYAAYMNAEFSNHHIKMFDALSRYYGLLDENKKLVDGIKGLSTAFVSFANTVDVSSQQAFSSAQNEFFEFQMGALDGYNAMLAAGFDEKQSLKEIQPILATLISLQNDYGFVIDTNTQALIDQAKDQGLSLEKQMTAEEKQIEVQEKMLSVLEQICKKFGADLPYAVELFSNTGEHALNNITGKTDEWEKGLDNVERQLRQGLPDAVTELDNIYTDKMTGHSIVTETNKWKDSLFDVEDLIKKDLPFAVSNLDADYNDAYKSINQQILEHQKQLEQSQKALEQEGFAELEKQELMRETAKIEKELQSLAARRAEIAKALEQEGFAELEKQELMRETAKIEKELQSLAARRAEIAKVLEQEGFAELEKQELMQETARIEKELQELTSKRAEIARKSEPLVEITEEIWEKIEGAAESTLDLHAAVSANMADIIRSAKINEDSFDNYVKRTGELIGDYERGAMSLKDVQKGIGDSFNELLKNAQELGTEGSRELIALLKDVRATGLEVAEIQEYINGKLDQGVTALGEYISSFKDNTGGIVENWSFIQTTTLSSFAALQAQGHSFIETVSMMQGDLASLATMAQENGLEISEGLQEMTDLAFFIDQEKELSTRIESVRAMMEALGDSAFLTASDFAAFTNQAGLQFDEIVDKTGDIDMALRLLAPTLEAIMKYSESYGFAIDESTRALIEQAQEKGYLLGESLTNPLTDVETVLSSELPEALESLDSEFQDVMSVMSETLHDMSETSALRTALTELSEFEITMKRIQQLAGIDPYDSPGVPPVQEYISAAGGYHGVLEDDQWFRLHRGEQVDVWTPEETRKGEYHKSQTSASTQTIVVEKPAQSGDTLIINNYFPETVSRENKETMVKSIVEALEDNYRGFKTQVREFVK